MIKAALRLLTCFTLVFGVVTIHAQQTIALNIGPAGQSCGRITTRNYCPLPAVNTATHQATLVTLDAMREQNLAGQQIGSGYIYVDGVEYFITGTQYTPMVGPTILSYDFINADASHGGHISVPTSTYRSSGGGGRGGGNAGTFWIALPSSTLTMF